LPAAPTNVVATAPSGRLVGTWNAAVNNGYNVTGYTMVANPGGKSIAVNGTTLTAQLANFTNGTMYTLSVTATNQFGTSLPGTSGTVTFVCSAHTYPNQDASDSASVDYIMPLATAEPTLFAGRQSNPDSDEWGWAKFSLSNVKSYATITGLAMSIKVADSAGSPSPVLELWYSPSISWFRNMNANAGPQAADIPKGMNVSATFLPVALNNYQSVTLSLAGHNWQADLNNGLVTLGVRNTVTPASGAFSYTQYYSSDTAGQRPQLIVTTCE
jgi:hypothetical protein